MKNAHAYTPDPLSRGGFFAGLAMDREKCVLSARPAMVLAANRHAITKRNSRRSNVICGSIFGGAAAGPSRRNT